MVFHDLTSKFFPLINWLFPSVSLCHLSSTDLVMSLTSQTGTFNSSSKKDHFDSHQNQDHVSFQSGLLARKSLLKMVTLGRRWVGPSPPPRGGGCGLGILWSGHFLDFGEKHRSGRRDVGPNVQHQNCVPRPQGANALKFWNPGDWSKIQD